jgi:uncharacterized membrane protein (UPF0127 family)
MTLAQVFSLTDWRMVDRGETRGSIVQYRRVLDHYPVKGHSVGRDKCGVNKTRGLRPDLFGLDWALTPAEPTRLLLLLVALVAVWFAASYPALPAEPLQRLEIVSSNGRHGFQVELARSAAERAKGLMFRRYMPPDRGMLFDFGTPEPAAMWMENTYLPLDMLFIRADGAVARIEKQAEPLSRRIIPAGEPVLAVLELNGGVCDELGIKAGDKVRHPMFEPR